MYITIITIYFTQKREHIKSVKEKIEQAALGEHVHTCMVTMEHNIDWDNMRSIVKGNIDGVNKGGVRHA